MRKYVLHKRLTPLVVVSVICFLFICPLIQPAAAADLNFEDYIVHAEVSGDFRTVTVSLPFDSTYFILWENDVRIDDHRGPEFYFQAGDFEESGTLYRLQMSPAQKDYLILSNVPKNSYLDISVSFRGPKLAVTGDIPDSMAYGYVEAKSFFYNSNYEQTKSYGSDAFQSDIVDTTGAGNLWLFSYQLLLSEVFPNDNGAFITSASYMRPSFFFYDMLFRDAGSYNISLLSYQIEMRIEDLVADDEYDDLLDSVNDILLDQGKKIDKLTGEVRETNQKLDDLLTGGEAGEILDQKDDGLSGAGDLVNDGLGAIDDFAGGYMAEASDRISELAGSADLTLLAAPLKFVQSCSNKVVQAIPSMYMVVFTLPMLLGVIMFVLNRPVRMPRFDRSGDRESRQMSTKSDVVRGRQNSDTGDGGGAQE